MNEQQLADLFSEQLDQLLLGEAPVIPAEATDLQELLGLGQQFSQVEFQISSAGQAAIQSQVATWFGPASASTAAISKTWLMMGIVLAIIAAGAGIGLGIPVVNSFLSGSGTTPEITEDPTSVPDSSQTSDNNSETIEIIIPDDNAYTVPNNSQGDIVPASTSSMGDTLPAVLPVQKTPSPRATFSLKDSLSIPVVEETEPLTTTVDGEVVGTTNENGEPVNGENSDSNSPGSGSDLDKDDRGHGNDADGFDEDNPGNSLGIEDLGRDGENSGGGSGQGGGSDKGNSDNKGGKGKGKDK